MSETCHTGVLTSRPLHPEDIVNVDVTLFYDGQHGDTSATFLLPEVDVPGRNLTDATKEALELGIRACGPGRRRCDIGKTIEWVYGSEGLTYAAPSQSDMGSL